MIQILVPFLTLVAVLVGLLALHSPSTAHVHAPAAGIANPVNHDHDHAEPAPTYHHAEAAHDHTSATDHGSAADAAVSIGPSGLTVPACPEGGGIECCVATAACVMVLALLSVSVAIGGGAPALVGAMTLLAVVMAFSLRVAPVRPPSLAQLSTFRI